MERRLSSCIPMACLVALSATEVHAVNFDSLLERALARDPSVSAAKSQEARSTALAKGETRWQETGLDLSTVDLGSKEWELTASQSFEAGDAASRRGAVARASITTAQAESAIRRAEITVSLRKAFHDARLCDLSIAWIDSQTTEADHLFNWQRRMVASGGLDPLDTLQTLLAIEDLRLTRSQWLNRKGSAIATIGRIADTNLTSAEAFPVEWPDPELSDRGADVSETMDGSTAENPWLRLSAAEIALAEAELQSQKLAGTPVVSLAAGLKGGEETGALLGVGISLPLFTGNAARTQAAKEQLTVVQALHAARLREIRAQVQHLRFSVREILGEYRSIVQTQETVARHMLSVYRSRYQQGILSQNILWEQSSQVNRLELRKIELLAQYADAIAELNLYSETY